MKKTVKKGEKCVLYDRDCIGCGECEFCDLDPLKICDNCGKCLNLSDYAAFKIDSVDGVELGGRASLTSHEHSHECCDCHDHDCDDDCGCRDHEDCDCCDGESCDCEEVSERDFFKEKNDGVLH